MTREFYYSWNFFFDGSIAEEFELMMLLINVLQNFSPYVMLEEFGNLFIHSNVFSVKLEQFYSFFFNLQIIRKKIYKSNINKPVWFNHAKSSWMYFITILKIE